MKVPIVNLVESSWYGEFQIVLDVHSDFTMETKEPTKGRNGRVQIFNI